MAGPGRRALYTKGGRLRLFWRLLFFTLLLVALYVVLATLLPPTLTGHAAALLTASVAAGWVLLGLEGRPPAALGFHASREAFSGTFLGLLLGAAVAALAGSLMAATGAVRWSPEPWTPGAWVAAAALSLAFLAPLAAAEEALLRGYPLQALSEAWGPAPALLVTSAAFGLLHAANPEVSWIGLVNTGLAGVFLGALYLRTGSLWWPSGAHLGWNWTHGFVMDLPVSGLEVVDAPGLEGHAVGPELLSGGAFGPEGSVLATVALVAAAAWTWSTGRLGPTRGARSSPPLALLERADTPAKGKR